MDSVTKRTLALGAGQIAAIATSQIITHHYSAEPFLATLASLPFTKMILNENNYDDRNAYKQKT